MPTLDEWEQALAAPRRVRVESSTTLLQEVQQRHAKEDAKRQQNGQPTIPRKDNLTIVDAFNLLSTFRLFLPICSTAWEW
jgi:hypothetical protein